MADKLINYLPEFYHDIADIIELTSAEDEELIKVKQASDQLFNNQFIVTSNEQGVKRREKMLGIQSDPAIETLDFRKKRIINRYTTKPPFSLRYLQDRLDYLVGTGKAITDVDVQNFILTVDAALEDAALFKEVEQTVKIIKPANLIYNQQTSMGDEMVLEEHIRKQGLTRQSRLRTGWHLGITPYAIADLEVTVK